MSSNILNISVVLIEPEHPGNIGAIARSMANFGLKDLVLIRPKVNHLDQDAIIRATHAESILKSAKVLTDLSQGKFDYQIATTAKLGNDYNVPRVPIVPEVLAKRLSELENANVAIIFGRESSGMSNEEIKPCDFVVHIPCDNKYPTMNLSHASTILFYEIFKARNTESLMKSYAPIKEKDKEVMLDKFNKIFDNLEFSTKEKRTTQEEVWKRIIGKSFMTKREGMAIMGLLKKIGEKLEKK